MQAVVQEDETGCGLAAVAAITGKKYLDVKAEAKQMGIDVKDNRLYSDTQYVSQLLKKSGYITGDKTPFISWDELPDLALLATKFHLENGCEFWHWVVHYRKNGQSFVLDSDPGLIKNLRSDLHQILPKWYIKVIKE